MAMLRGEITKFGRTEEWVHAVGKTVVVQHRGQTIGAGVVDRDNRFEIELPSGIRGELEITVAAQGAAPSLVDAEGDDLEVTVIYNPGGAYY
ncbi:MAG: hypothetical protein AAF547_17310 [Actinomycetota bacterium]